MKCLVMLGVLLSCAAGMKARAQTNLLTLAEARKRAFAANWDLLAAKTGIDAATAQQITAKEYPNPTASAAVLKINTDGNPTGTRLGDSLWHRNYDTILAVSQLVEVGGKRSSRQSSARAGLAGARARFYDAKRLLDQGVTKAYVAALLAEQNVKILNQSAASLRHEAEIAATRFQAGDISDSDKKRIEINASRFESDARAAEVAAASARIAVEVLMGMEHPQGIWAPGDSLDGLVVTSARASEVEPGALPRLDLAAAEADLRKAGADVHLQKALRIPDPTFLLQYEHEPPDQPDTVGFGISFPLPLWNWNRSGIKAAEAAQKDAALQVEKVRAQTVSDLLIAERTYREATERRQRYETQIRPKSEAVRQAVAFAYEKGGASLVDLLTAERDDNDVRLAAAQAQADSANAAADLAAAGAAMPERMEYQ